MKTKQTKLSTDQSIVQDLYGPQGKYQFCTVVRTAYTLSEFYLLCKDKGKITGDEKPMDTTNRIIQDSVRNLNALVDVIRNGKPRPNPLPSPCPTDISIWNSLGAENILMLANTRKHIKVLDAGIYFEGNLFSKGEIDDIAIKFSDFGSCADFKEGEYEVRLVLQNKDMEGNINLKFSHRFK